MEEIRIVRGEYNEKDKTPGYYMYFDDSKKVVHKDTIFELLKEYFSNIDSSNENILFRGQTKGYAPIPSLFRKDYSHLRENDEEYYKMIYVDNPHEFEGMSPSKTDLKFISKIQHYDYPTCLLDVSTNPYKALGFVVDKLTEENLDVDNKPCLYIFKLRNTANKVYESDTQEKIDNQIHTLPLIIPARNKRTNERLFAQSGQFIYFSQYEETEQLMHSLEGKYEVSKISFEIDSASELKNLEKDLDVFHYPISELYPDLTKRAEYYKSKWNK